MIDAFESPISQQDAFCWVLNHPLYCLYRATTQPTPEELQESLFRTRSRRQHESFSMESWAKTRKILLNFRPLQVAKQNSACFSNVSEKRCELISNQHHHRILRPWSFVQRSGIMSPRSTAVVGSRITRRWTSKRPRSCTANSRTISSLLSLALLGSTATWCERRGRAWWVQQSPGGVLAASCSWLLSPIVKTHRPASPSFPDLLWMIAPSGCNRLPVVRRKQLHHHRGDQFHCCKKYWNLWSLRWVATRWVATMFARDRNMVPWKSVEKIRTKSGDVSTDLTQFLVNLSC